MQRSVISTLTGGCVSSTMPSSVEVEPTSECSGNDGRIVVWEPGCGGPGGMERTW